MSGKTSSNLQNIVVPSSTQPDAGQGFSFSQQMKDYTLAQYEEYLKELKNKIFLQGETIKKKADLSEYMQYRKLIAELLEMVAGNAYACSRTSTFDAKGRRNVFVLIRKVNEKLDEMAQEILSEGKRESKAA